MSIGILTLHIHLPGSNSLKAKRGRIQPIIARLHREFNLSVAEIGLQDKWQEAVLACALISNDHGYTQHALQNVANFFSQAWPDLDLIDDHIELI